MTRDGQRGRGRLRRRVTDDSPAAGWSSRQPGEAARPALRASGLTRMYGQDESLVWAVDRVDLDVPVGQTLA
ncbi:MAG TPA: hypothetical protein VN714_04680, partial [Trebonia sp.]|nr:hypothetical protein [Trebonia sp.]